MNTQSNIVGFAEINDPRHTAISVRDAIRASVSRPVVSLGINPFINNGSVHGSKILDMRAALQIVLADDKEHGNTLASCGMNEMDLIKRLMSVLRERIQFNNAWKKIGINPKLLRHNPDIPVTAPDTPTAPQNTAA